MNNLIYWMETKSENIEELFDSYYELLDIIESNTDYKVHKNTSFGEYHNTMKITIWQNMN